jgi:hypothetical protein
MMKAKAVAEQLRDIAILADLVAPLRREAEDGNSVSPARCELNASSTRSRR